MTPELNPCPFCGGAPVLENEAARKYVYCSVCEADGTWDGDEQTAIDAWNRRTTPEATGIYESAWVIEGMWSSAAYPEYWVGSSAWSSDPYKALRFASKESAQQAADMMLVGINHRVACHEFAGNSHHE